MAETSLRAYQDKLDSLLLEDKLDAVVAHARHILNQYPRNLRAWGQLSLALTGQGRLREAAAVMRRLLAARPLDFQTHWRLAQLCQRLGQNERARLHAERALDQRPHDAATADFLRRLRADAGGDEIDDIEPSAAGLAQECIRRSQLDEATRILDAALENEPGRVDLQLLRSRALWLDGNRMAAAEAADAILGRLPYAIAANRIMAELWLSERRPSDARAYLERIEALDPYLAHQLAGSGLPADDLITLEELDLDEAEAADSAGESLDLPQLADDIAIESLFSQAQMPRPKAQEPDAISFQAAGQTEAAAELDSDDNLSSLDDDLALMLEQLDSDAETGASWLTEVQGLADESAIDEEFADDWLDVDEADEAADEVAGAPWLATPAHGLDSKAEDDFDLFAEDEQLQALLGGASDTEPINLEDIDAWLNDEREAAVDSGAADAELLASPGADWLDEEMTPLSADERQQRNMALIEGWGAELGDEDDDPYVDWLSEELAADIDPGLEAAAASDAPAADAPADETARAWGLRDAGELADFVAEEASVRDAESSPDWLNAALPGMDRQGDAEPDNPEEFARPIGRPGRDFAWVNDIVDEETGEMQAVDLPEAPADIPYFRFDNPPVWLANMALPMAPGGLNRPMAAGPLIDDIDELDLDDLTFDDYFNVDAPTDRLDAISLDDGVDNINFAEMGWDDYFEFESPTEKTIAISLDDEVGGFKPLGVDDGDLTFDTPTDKMRALDLGDDLNAGEFDDIGLDDAPPNRDRDKGDANA